jgi:uncharacterized protein (TIGR04141 family)
VRINLHLFNENIDCIEKAQKECRLENYSSLKVRDAKVVNYAAFIKKSKEKVPTWHELVSGLFEMEKEETFTVSCLVLMNVDYKEKARVYGLSFGYAHNAIPPNYIEAKFGLKVALNIVAGRGLKTLASRTIDHNIKQKQMHVSVDSDLNEFGFDANEDWLFSVEGKVKTEYQELCKTIKGRDSVSFDFQGSLHDLIEKCKKAMEYYELENYKADYEFIDALNEIKKDSELDMELTAMLIGHIKKTGAEGRVVMANPEIFELNPDRYEFSYKRKAEEYEYISMSNVYDYIKKHPDVDVKKINVRARDFDGNTIGKVYLLLDYLVAEIDHKSKTYVYTWGRWFELDKDYQKITKNKMKHIEDITDSLNLPDMYRASVDGKTRYEDEDVYNKRASKALQGVVFDKKFVFFKEKQKVEICDFLTQNDQFVCVKKMNESASMSHLFSQGVNTAYLLRGDDKFKKETIRRLGRPVNEDKASIVFGLVARRDGQIKDTLFFFSQMSLLRAVKDIEGRGYKAVVAKIATKEVAALPPKKKN